MFAFFSFSSFASSISLLFLSINSRIPLSSSHILIRIIFKTWRLLSKVKPATTRKRNEEKKGE